MEKESSGNELKEMWIEEETVIVWNGFRSSYTKFIACQENKSKRKTTGLKCSEGGYILRHSYRQLPITDSNYDTDNNTENYIINKSLWRLKVEKCILLLL